MRILMSQGLGLTLAGVAVGAIVALGTTRLMGDMLYHVSPRDPLAFVSAFVVMTIVSTGACLAPALRVLRTDPVNALRDD